MKAVEGGTTIVTLHSGNDIVHEIMLRREVDPPLEPPPPETWIIIDDPVGPITMDPALAPQGSGITVTSYLALNGKYLAKIVRENSNPAQTYFLHADMVGSIRAITDSAGEVVARLEYEPFGLLAMSTGPMAAGAHRFTGKPEDGATELYYFGARYYDPEVGRFISRDPAKDGLNWYAYCRQNPLAYVDRNALWADRIHGEWTWKAAEAVGLGKDLAKAVSSGAVHCDAWWTGKSAAPVVGDLSWHFDTNPDPSVDSRLANFEKSLEMAVFLLERGWEKAAFYVLGYGIHAVQDVFAHGDSTPLDHVWAVVIGTMQKAGQTGKLELWSWMDAADMDGPNTPVEGGESWRARTAQEVTAAILQGFRNLLQSIRGLFRD